MTNYKNKLVAYFSASGVTRNVAKALAKAANAVLYEIKPQVPYTASDLNWNDKNSRSTIEMHNESFRPAIADKNANVGAYDTVFLGFPIWWFTAPTIINTFLESYDFKGKKIVIFATSLGSDLGQTVSNLKRSVDDSAIIIEGKVLSSNQPQESLTAWINSLKI